MVLHRIMAGGGYIGPPREVVAASTLKIGLRESISIPINNNIGILKSP